MKHTTIIIRVTVEMKQAMQKIARKNRRTLSNYLRVLIEDKIEEHRVANQGTSLSDSSAKICPTCGQPTAGLKPNNLLDAPDV